MPKILLVEDDNNLREIYEMLLSAEGYTIVTASDGEEGLSTAIKEKPDLIIADVMMPKLSGFEMVENLKAAPEMKNVKVIMMTALGQAEDQARGKSLGVVKYLVKSQSTLEDFARVVKEVLPPASGKVTNNQLSDSSTNKQEGEKTMQEDNATNNPSGGDAPADPAAGAPAANPMDAAGGPADAGTPGAPSDQPADSSGSFAPATPPADDAPADAPADAGADGGGGDAGGNTPPAAPPQPGGSA